MRSKLASSASRPRSGLGAAAALLAVLSASRPAPAAQTDITISVGAAAGAPRILGPRVIGSRPGTPFLYTIPSIGTAPVAFAASGLPAGLSLDAITGTIQGKTPPAGAYPIALTVSNGVGQTTDTLTLSAGATVALTPPLGWNSYDSFGSSVTESDVLAAAQAMKKQLQPFGWNTVVVDFLWSDPEDAVDASGRFLPSPSRFPSAAGGAGFKPLADKVHALGLNFGIHIMRGIPRKTVTANSPIANSTFTAASAANTSDACPWDSHMWGVMGTAAGQAWYDSIFAQYAGWGVDFVKVDDMINPYSTPLNYHQAEVDAIRSSIDGSGRSIVLSLSPGPMQTRDAADLNANANMWRMVNDFWDSNGLSTLSDVFTAAGTWQATSGLSAGHWPDADMLPLGYLGPRCPVHASGPTAFSHNQQVTVMSLWSLLPSPLMFGGNLPALSTDATGPFTIALLTNEEVLAVHDDSSGTRAKRVAQQGTTEVWARDLSGGRKAVGLFNRGTQDAVVSVTFAELGVSGAPAVRDLWHRADQTGVTTGLSVTVPHDGALLYLLYPPGTAPGTTADAGVDLDAGPLDSGSSTSGPGAVDASGVPGSAGAFDAGGPSPGPDAGARDSNSAADADAGSSSTEDASMAGPRVTGAGSSHAASCACRAAGGGRGPGGALFVALWAGAGLALRRRRRRPVGHALRG